MKDGNNPSDWMTQNWVRATGRKISFADYPWLLGPRAQLTPIAALDRGCDALPAGSRSFFPFWSDHDLSAQLDSGGAMTLDSDTPGGTRFRAPHVPH
jgi:hypothetical protein